MTSHRRSPNDFPSGLAGRLDAVCDRFEAELQAGRRPRLEDFLAQVNQADRSALLHELLGIDLHHRRRQGDQPTAREYRQRLAGYEPVVAAAFSTVPTRGTSAQVAELPRVPGYELLEVLGAGGMGQVYKARHRLMKRIVALKVIRQECLGNPNAVRRFQREVQAVAQLAHPNIVLAYDADQAGAMHFFVMEYVPGKDLKQLVKDRGPLPVAQACSYMEQAAQGLQHAHENGLVHRDIKPGNLIVDSRGVLKILDLGLARMVGDSAMTREGAIIGSVDFMAPEQARQSHTVDIRGDLYSLGCTFYYLLTGQVPFPGGTMVEKLRKQAEEKPVPLTELRPEIPPAVAAIVRKLMAKDPDQRYPTPAALADALAGLAVGRRPRRRLLWLMVVAGLTVSLAGVVYLTPLNRPVAQVDQEQEQAPVRSPVDQELEQLLARSKDPAVQPETLRDAILDFCLKYAGRPQAYQAGALLPKLPRWENTIGMRFAPIPPGTFLMGSPAHEPGRSEGNREGPRHEVEITRPFYLGVYPVKVGQFKAFVKATNHQTEAGALVVGPDGQWARDDKASWQRPGFKQLDSHPVVCVSWKDAERFCDWLSTKEGKRYTLPTEAQWEYGCRAGSRTRFFFGDTDTELGDYAWSGGTPVHKTYPVGQKKPNAWGLYDMIGNARQWCQDIYATDYYQNSPLQDPAGPKAGSDPKRVVRGSSWTTNPPFSAPPAECRSAYRLSHAQSERRNNRGFRVVLLLAPPGQVRP